MLFRLRLFTLPPFQQFWNSSANVTRTRGQSQWQLWNSCYISLLCIISNSSGSWSLCPLVLTQHLFLLPFLFLTALLSWVFCFPVSFFSVMLIFFSFLALWITNPPHAFNYRPMTHKSLHIIPTSGMNFRLINSYTLNNSI